MDENEKKGKSSFKKLFLITLVLLLACGLALGAAVYFNKKDDQYPALELKKVKLDKELLRFTYDNLSEVYTGLVEINSEMLIIDKELERLKAIQKRFPKQTKIIEDEEKNLYKLQSTLSKALGELENRIEAIFVTYAVNMETGNKKIAEEKAPLKSKIDEALNTSKATTTRLKEQHPEVKQTLLEKILAKLGLDSKK